MSPESFSYTKKGKDVFEKEKVGAVIVAAGRGERMEGVDKLFSLLNGEPVLALSVLVFENSPLVDRIVLVLRENAIGKGVELAAEKKWRKVTDVCPGGERRQDSVANGLKLLSDCDWIIIHDGARPLVTEKMIEDGLEVARESGASAAAVPVKDTIKRVGDDRFVAKTPPRTGLWAAQTPQVFRRDMIIKAYSEIKESFTDDALLVEKTGVKVKVFMGSYDNIKITTPNDLELAEIIGRKGGN